MTDCKKILLTLIYNCKNFFIHRRLFLSEKSNAFPVNSGANIGFLFLNYNELLKINFKVQFYIHYIISIYFNSLMHCLYNLIPSFFLYIYHLNDSINASTVLLFSFCIFHFSFHPLPVTCRKFLH